LAELLFNAIEAKAGCPGGNAVPEWAREREILKLRQARQAKVCTLNEFRQYLGLKCAFDVCPHLRPRLNVPFAALQSFEEWNPKLADSASKVYGSIDELELYVRLKLLSHDSLTNISKPGLLCEGSNYDSKPGLLCEGSNNRHGFGFGYTMV
jgi:hypothetical protein